MKNNRKKNIVKKLKRHVLFTGMKQQGCHSCLLMLVQISDCPRHLFHLVHLYHYNEQELSLAPIGRDSS